MWPPMLCATSSWLHIDSNNVDWGYNVWSRSISLEQHDVQTAHYAPEVSRKAAGVLQAVIAATALAPIY